VHTLLVKYVLDANIVICRPQWSSIRPDQIVRRHVGGRWTPDRRAGRVDVRCTQVEAARGESRQNRRASPRHLRTAIHGGGRDLYGSIRAELEARGLVKSDFDLIIACTALTHDAALVTSDGALLDGAIPGLRAENWLVVAGGESA